jgi:hypothetical protein
MDIGHMLESASNIGFREKLLYPLLMRNSINEVNKKLIKELLEEGKHVVKAQETNNEKQPWEFSPVPA